jgi:hypothetical protein
VLEMMERGDTIAPTTDECVAIAARLGCDKPWRMAVKARISSNEDFVQQGSDLPRKGPHLGTGELLE